MNTNAVATFHLNSILEVRPLRPTNHVMNSRVPLSGALSNAVASVRMNSTSLMRLLRPATMFLNSR